MRRRTARGRQVRLCHTEERLAGLEVEAGAGPGPSPGASGQRQLGVRTLAQAAARGVVVGQPASDLQWTDSGPPGRFESESAEGTAAAWPSSLRPGPGEPARGTASGSARLAPRCGPARRTGGPGASRWVRGRPSDTGHRVDSATCDTGRLHTARGASTVLRYHGPGEPRPFLSGPGIQLGRRPLPSDSPSRAAAAGGPRRSSGSPGSLSGCQADPPPLLR